MPPIVASGPFHGSSDAGLNVNGQVRRIVFRDPAEPREIDRAVGLPQRIAELRLCARAERNDRAFFRSNNLCEFFDGFRLNHLRRREVVDGQRVTFP